MEAVYPIRETVTVLTITKQAQKIKFQVRHPENMNAIIGIAVTTNKMADPIGKGPDKGDTVGYLALSIPEKGDIVFGEDVKLDNNEYADIVERAVSGASLPVGNAKKRDLYFETFYKLNKAVLEGFYEDTYLPDLNGGDGKPLPYLYRIRIYIRYQVKGINQNTDKP